MIKSLSFKQRSWVIGLLFSVAVNAQNVTPTTSKPEHRIIFQFSSADTTAHKQLMKQFANILKVSPSTKIEVVCQGGALEMLMSSKSIVAEKIKQLSEKGVVFNACEFAMKERKIEKSQMIPQAGFVPAGVIEIVSKQEEGWSYIRSTN